MSKLLKARVGAAVVGLALPMALVLPASADHTPAADEVGEVAVYCAIDLGYSISECTEAVSNGVEDTVIPAVEEAIAGTGYVLDVDLGTPNLADEIVTQTPGVPVPVIANPPVPGVEYPE